MDNALLKAAACAEKVVKVRQANLIKAFLVAKQMSQKELMEKYNLMKSHSILSRTISGHQDNRQCLQALMLELPKECWHWLALDDAKLARIEKGLVNFRKGSKANAA